MDDSVIHEGDLVQLDGTIDKLIDKLGTLRAEFVDMTNEIKKSADGLAQSVRAINSLSIKGTDQLGNAATAANQLKQAHQELREAMELTEKSMTEMKAQTNASTKANVEQAKFLESAEGSYDQMAKELKSLISQYKALSATERESAEGSGALLGKIQELTLRIKALDAEMKPHLEGMSKLAKLEREAAYLESEEGKQVLDLQKKIRQLKSERQQTTRATRESNRTTKESIAISEEVKEVSEKYGFSLKQQVRYQKYADKAARSTQHSYDWLAAQYEMTTMKANRLSMADQKQAESLVKLTSQAAEYYKKMIKIQASMGKHTLRVGDYRSAWDGLGISVNQIVRELPSAAMSLNTFFVAISNNIPILMDEINKAIAKNKILQEQGLQTIKIGKSIIRAIFSWNTVIVLIVTALSMFGKEIFQFIGRLLNLQKVTLSTKKALKNIANELNSTNASYGQNIVLFGRLKEEFEDLSSVAEKQAFLEKYRSEFDALGTSVSNVNDLEALFSKEGTENMVKSLRKRARAAAAFALAEKEYEKSFIAQAKADAKRKEMPIGESARIPYADPYQGQNVSVNSSSTMVANAAAQEKRAMEVQKKVSEEKVRGLERESLAAANAGDKYMELANAEGVELDASTKSAKNRGTKLKDLTERIIKMRLDAEKKYQDSVLEIQEDSYAKQRMELVTANEQKNDELTATYNRNLEWLKGSGSKYKALTEEQKQAIIDANQEIQATIENNDKALADDLIRLATETELKRLKVQEEGLEIRKDNVKKGSAEESALRLSAIKTERDIEIMENRLKIKEEQQDEEEIIKKYARKIQEVQVQIWGENLSTLEKHLHDRLALVRKNSEDELELQLELLEIERKRALIEDSLLDADGQRGAKAINQKYAAEKRMAIGSFELGVFENQQKLEQAKFEITKKSTYATKRFELKQEKDLARKKLDLYRKGLLNISAEEVATLEAILRKVDEEIKEIERDWSAEGILSRLGFDDASIDALREAVEYVVDQIHAIIDAEIELRKKQVELAKERVESTKKSYEAEIEARNNGYANNVETTRKEFLLAKENERKKQKMLEEAQARAAKLDTITQASSLLTASAEIFKSLSGIPIVGPALAIAAIGTMWTTFALAKAKSKQIASQEYGKGGLEFMQGGSHSSGHDIDLGVNNSKGKRMRVEGGEAVAVISKPNTRKYRKQLPDIINSLNKGIFEDKYGKIFPTINETPLVTSSVNLTKIENSLDMIQKQGRDNIYSLPDGTIIREHNNVKTIIHK